MRECFGRDVLCDGIMQFRGGYGAFQRWWAADTAPFPCTYTTPLSFINYCLITFTPPYTVAHTTAPQIRSPVCWRSLHYESIMKNWISCHIRLQVYNNKTQDINSLSLLIWHRVDGHDTWNPVHSDTVGIRQMQHLLSGKIAAVKRIMLSMGCFTCSLLHGWSLRCII